MESIQIAEQRLSEAMAELAEAQQACEKAEARHREDVTCRARPSEITRSETTWLEAQRAVRRAQWTVDARDAELRDAQAANAAAVEAARLEALAAAWSRRDAAGEKINALIAELAATGAEFDAAGDAIIAATPGTGRAAAKESLFNQAQRLIPALVQAVSPTPGKLSGLVKAVGEYRPLWNDRLGGKFYGKPQPAIVEPAAAESVEAAA